MTMAPDYLVEVRDRNFIRHGQIAPEYLDLMFVEVFRGVGDWQLKLPAEHPLLEELKTKGSGIVITQRSSGHVFSGRTQSAVLSQDAEDPNGTWVIKGKDDGIVAAATVVYPSPSLAADAQATDYWVSTGAGESVMKSAIQVNIGPGATAARKYPWLTWAPDLTRGTTVKVSARFDNLGELLTSVGIQANLGWTFSQVDDGVVFDVFEPADKTGLIRLDVRNGGLESTELGFSAPSATQVLVMGQGEGVERTIRPVTSTEADAEAVSWGLRWEATKDQRNTDDPVELQGAGEEILELGGLTQNSLKVTPSDAPGQRLGEDWWLGDRVTVVIDGQETSAIVQQVATAINSAGVIQQATVGDPVGFDWEAKVGTKLKDHEARIKSVETLIGGDGLIPLSRISYSQLGTADLDTITAQGYYEQTTGANGTLARHYPKETTAGLLEVLQNGSHYMQRMTLRGDSVNDGRVFVRSKYSSGAWQAWVELTTPPLPDAATAQGAATTTITATVPSWATQFTKTIGPFDRALAIDVQIGAIVKASTGYTMIGVNLTGGVTLAPDEIADGTSFSGFTPFSSSTVDTAINSITKRVVLPAGTQLTAAFWARRSIASGTQTVNYPWLSLMPNAWAD